MSCIDLLIAKIPSSKAFLFIHTLSTFGHDSLEGQELYILLILNLLTFFSFLNFEDL